jgi:hypothetical protein
MILAGGMMVQGVLKTLPNNYFKFMTPLTAATILLKRWTKEWIMRRCLVIRKRLALQRRYKQRVLKRRHLQPVNGSELAELLVRPRATRMND